MAKPPRVLRTRHILGLLAAEEIYTRRETIAPVSDVLFGPELKTNQQRTWTHEQAELLVKAFVLNRRFGLDWEEITALLEDRAAGEALVEEFRSVVTRLGELVTTAA